MVRPWSASPELSYSLYGPQANASWLPFLYIISTIVFAAIVLGCSQAFSPMRPTSVFLLGTNVYVSLVYLPVFCSHPIWNSLLTVQVPMLFLTGTDKLCIRRVVFLVGKEQNRGRENAPREGSPAVAYPRVSLVRRIRYGIDILLNLRGIGTDWEAKKGVSPVIDRNTGKPPARMVFLRDRIIRATILYLISDWVTHEKAPPTQTSFSVARENVFLTTHYPTIEDLRTRLVTFPHWVASAMALILVNDLMSIISVTLHLHEPKDWPAVFGRPTSFYTIRAFWGECWHQLLRQPLTANATFLVDGILRIPKSTLLSRYTNLYLVFLLSGLVHTCQDAAIGIWPESHCLWYFNMQAFGIMFEDLVVFIYHRVASPERRPWWHWTRALGFLWLLAWFVWTDPPWKFPHLRADERIGMRVFPSIFGAMKLAKREGKHL